MLPSAGNRRSSLMPLGCLARCCLESVAGFSEKVWIARLPIAGGRWAAKIFRSRVWRRKDEATVLVHQSRTRILSTSFFRHHGNISVRCSVPKMTLAIQVKIVMGAFGPRFVNHCDTSMAVLTSITNAITVH